MKKITVFVAYMLYIPVISLASNSTSQQSLPLPKYNETKMQERCAKFLQSLNPMQVARDYPKAIENLFSFDQTKMNIGLKTLKETNDPNVIPWIILLLDYNDDLERQHPIPVKIQASVTLRDLISSYTLKRRDMSIPTRVVIKPLAKNDLDMRPLAWIVLKMIRKTGDQSTGAWIAGYLNLTYFDEELQLLSKSSPGGNNAGFALDMLKNGHGNKPTQMSEKEKEQEQYKVYSDVLVEMNPTKDFFVIRKTTTTGLVTQTDKQLTKFLKSSFSERLSDDIIQEFLKVRKKEDILDDNFNKDIQVVLISKDELDVIFKTGNNNIFYSDFYLKYPKSGGIIDVSRVAFNKDGTKALLHYGIASGGLSGRWYYLLLKKQGDDWVIQEQVLTGMS
jgi:hypothetical protein